MDAAMSLHFVRLERYRIVLGASIFLCACLALVWPSLAQEKPGPKNFYRRDFAAGTGFEGKEEPPGKSITPENARHGEDPIKPPQESPDERQTRTTQPEQGAASSDDEKGIPVLGIGAVLNSLDKDHFFASIKELSDTAIRFDLGIGEVYAIGTVLSAFDTNQDLIRIFARGGGISIRSTAPEAYKVGRSPSWILYTKEGEILLEATGPLAANFNQKGEFVDRHSHLESLKGEESAPAESPAEAATASPAPIELEEIK